MNLDFCRQATVKKLDKESLTHEGLVDTAAREKCTIYDLVCGDKEILNEYPELRNVEPNQFASAVGNHQVKSHVPTRLQQCQRAVETYQVQHSIGFPEVQRRAGGPLGSILDLLKSDSTILSSFPVLNDIGEYRFNFAMSALPSPPQHEPSLSFDRLERNALAPQGYGPGPYGYGYPSGFGGQYGPGAMGVPPGSLVSYSGEDVSAMTSQMGDLSVGSLGYGASPYGHGHLSGFGGQHGPGATMGGPYAPGTLYGGNHSITGMTSQMGHGYRAGHYGHGNPGSSDVGSLNGPMMHYPQPHTLYNQPPQQLTQVQQYRPAPYQHQQLTHAQPDSTLEIARLEGNYKFQNKLLDVINNQWNAKREARTKKEQADAYAQGDREKAQADREKTQAKIQEKLIDSIAGGKPNDAPNSGYQGLGDKLDQAVNKFGDNLGKFTVAASQLRDDFGKMSSSITKAVDRQVFHLSSKEEMSSEDLCERYRSNRGNVASNASPDQIRLTLTTMDDASHPILAALHKADTSLSSYEVLAIGKTGTTNPHPIAFIKFGPLSDGSTLDFHYTFKTEIAAPLVGFTKSIEINVKLETRSEDDDGSNELQLIVMMDPTNENTCILDPLLCLLFENALDLRLKTIDLVGIMYVNLNGNWKVCAGSQERERHHRLGEVVLPATLEHTMAAYSPGSPQLTLGFTNIAVQPDQAKVLGLDTASNITLKFEECNLPSRSGKIDYHKELERFFSSHDPRLLKDCSMYWGDEVHMQNTFSMLADEYGVPNPLDLYGRNFLLEAIGKRLLSLGSLNLIFHKNKMHPEDNGSVLGALATFNLLAKDGKLGSLELSHYEFESKEVFKKFRETRNAMEEEGHEVITDELGWGI